MLRMDGPATELLSECDDCGATGRRMGTSTRLTAMDKLMKAVEQRSKLRGLYAPEKIAFTNTKGEDMSDYEREIRSWAPEDIERELAELLGDGDEMQPLDFAD